MKCSILSGFRNLHFLEAINNNNNNNIKPIPSEINIFAV